jgi:hypothetical protein
MNISRKLVVGIVAAVLISVIASAYVLFSVVTSLQTQVNQLKDQNFQLQQKNVNLQDQVSQLQVTSAQLETNYTNLQNQTIALQDRSSQLEANYTNLQNQTNLLQNMTSQLETNYTALYNEVNPVLQVTYLRQQPGVHSGVANGTDYIFNVTGSRESFQLSTSEAIDQALAPLIGKYPFITMTSPGGITVPYWTSQYAGNGQFTFTLLLKSELTTDQIQALTQDLSNALKNT